MKSLQGQLLVATPKLMDPNFFHTVILMVQHSDEGALGVVLNRPLETTIQTAWEQVSEIPCNIEGVLHQGGPCEGPLMVVHGDAALSQIEVVPGVHFSTDKDSVEQLVTNESGPAKFFVGYSGWAGGQLEREMEEGAWLTIEATSDRVFSGGTELWETLLKTISRAAKFPYLNPKLIPDDPSLN